MKSAESSQAIAGVDDLFASVGLKPGSRATLKGSWSKGERIPRKVHVKATPAAAKSKKKPVKKKPLEVVRTASFSREKGLIHGFSTRPGGVTSVYRPWLEGGDGDLNLSWTKEDTPRNVSANRTLFLRETARLSTQKNAEMQLVTLRQLHSPIVQVIEKGHKKLATKDGRAVLRGDAFITDQPNLLLGIQTADCIPILIYDRKTHAVAAFHAGWRPTLARIVERGIGRMRLQYGTNPKDIIAAIGPGIGPCCYAVGEEIEYEFESQFAYAKSLFTEVFDEDPVRLKYPLLFLTQRAPGHSPIGPQTHLNLWEANRRQLLDAGVPAKNITVTELCTACNTERFFSHRAERGFTGRMLNVIGTVAERKSRAKKRTKASR